MKKRAATPRPPPPGPGRPRKPRPPRDSDQADLASEVKSAESERDAAGAKYRKDATVAAEMRLLRAELAVSSAWASYLRAQGLHSAGLRYIEVAAKLAARIAALRELEAIDQLTALQARAAREDELG